MKSLKNCLSIFKKDETGGVLILVALLLVILMVFTALVVDVGALYVVRRQLVTAADAAALAGAQEMALNGDEVGAIAIAQSYASYNWANLTNNQAAIENRNYNGEIIKVVVSNIKTSEDLIFARVIGPPERDVSAYAAATWGYPLSACVFPIFYIIEYVDDEVFLPSGEILLKHKDEIHGPGNWGFLDTGTGAAGIHAIFRGEEECIDLSVDDNTEEGHFDTQPGVIQSTIKPLEDRMQDDSLSMKVFIPILDTFDGEGKTEVIVIGFALYEILDVITEVTKEENDLWYGKGSIHARFEEAPSPPRLYSNPYEEGYEKKKDVDVEYPKGTIIGRFVQNDDGDRLFIPYKDFINQLTQDENYDFGITVIYLVE